MKINHLPTTLNLKMVRKITSYPPHLFQSSLLNYTLSEPGLSKIHALDYDLTPCPIQTHRRSSKNHNVHIASLILKIRIITGALRVQICLEGRERAISSVTIYDPLLDDIVCPPLEEEPRDFGVQWDRERDDLVDVDSSS